MGCMSPELLHPDKSGAKGVRPAKRSDGYAFRTIIYEVLSGQTPFALLHHCVVMRKVIEGERPRDRTDRRGCDSRMIYGRPLIWAGRLNQGVGPLLRPCSSVWSRFREF